MDLQGFTRPKNEFDSKPSTFTKCYWKADGQLVCNKANTPVEPVVQFDNFTEPNGYYNPTNYLQLYK